VYDPVVNKVLGLVQELLAQSNFQCQKIFLANVAGNQYLLEKLRSLFSNKTRLIIGVVRPELATSRGAVYMGLYPQMMASRIERQWYGVSSSLPFDVRLDRPEKKQWSAEGYAVAADRFYPYTMPGQQIGIDEYVSTTMMNMFPQPVTLTLYASNSVEEPRYIDDPRVKLIGYLTICPPIQAGIQHGQQFMANVKLFFGQIEIRAEAIVNGFAVEAQFQFVG
jgi:hypothetical protein